MNNPLKFFLILLFTVGLAGIGYLEFSRNHGLSSTVAEAPKPGEAEVSKPEPAIQYPVDTGESSAESSAESSGEGSGSEGEAPVTPPSAKTSPAAKAAGPQQPTLESSLSELLGKPSFDALLRAEDLAPHIVVAVSNQSGPQIPVQFLPWIPVPGEFKVKKENGSIFLIPENSERYQPYFKALEAVDSKALVGLYVRFYPLFQRAFRETGSKDYFNDKVVAAIDNLLAAPEPIQPIELQQPLVFYHFADSQLEALNAGQKIMIRIGPENSRRLKAKLKEWRALLTHLGKVVAH